MIRRLLKRRRFMREHRWTQAHLSGYVDEELPDGERVRAEEHIGICPECRRVLATLRRTLAGLRGLHTAAGPNVANGVIERLRDEG